MTCNLRTLKLLLTDRTNCMDRKLNSRTVTVRVYWTTLGKIQIECRLAWHWWNSTNLGLIDMFFFVYFHSENRSTSQILKVLPNIAFPSPIWGKKWRRSEHAHANYPGLWPKAKFTDRYSAGILDNPPCFRPPGCSPHMGREERRVQGLD